MLEEGADSGGRERLEPDDLGERVGPDRLEKLGGGAALVVSRGDDECRRQLLEPRQQEGEEAKGRHVGPVGVVHDEAGGPARGQIRAQPVEPVQHGERPVAGAGRIALGRGGRTGQAESPSREARCARQQLLALGGRRCCERRLEQLANDSERELALQLGSAAPEDAHPARLGGRTRAGHERGLSHPGRAFDDDEAPVSFAGPVERRLHPRELVPALDQRRALRKHGAGGLRPHLRPSLAHIGTNVGFVTGYAGMITRTGSPASHASMSSTVCS